MKFTIKWQPFLLVFLLGIGIFPFNILCHSKDPKSPHLAVFQKKTVHHACAFCKLFYFNDFIGNQKIEIVPESIGTPKLGYTCVFKENGLKIAFRNKSPPVHFI